MSLLDLPHYKIPDAMIELVERRYQDSGTEWKIGCWQAGLPVGQHYNVTMNP